MVYSNTKTVQRLIRLMKAKSKRTFLRFNTASGTSYEDIRTFHRCRRHRFATKALLCNKQYFYVIVVYLNNAHITHCCVRNATMVRRTRHNVTLYLHCLTCLLILSRLQAHCPNLYRRCHVYSAFPLSSNKSNRLLDVAIYRI